MEKLRKVFFYFKDKYDLLSSKRYTTLAGTLVFFLIMSIVPLAFWLTLLIGRFPFDAEAILKLAVFDSVKDILEYVRKEAADATASTSLILLVTTLYSSTNLFYQMRKSGEIIYGYRGKKQGWRMRLGALALMFVIMFAVIIFLLFFALSSFLFSLYLPFGLDIFADYLLLGALSFALVLLLNSYVCPYKKPLKSFVHGTLITVSAWAVASLGFTIYLRLSNVDKLYGALSAIIVFLLWAYMLMIGFIAGVIFNSDRIAKSRKQKKSASEKRGKRMLAHKTSHTAFMKISKLKSSLLAGLATLLFTFPNLRAGKLPEITKPYLGVYECARVTLGSNDYTEDFEYIRLELKGDGTFLLTYAPKDGVKGSQKGEYEYDDEKKTLCLSLGGEEIKRKFPLENGEILVNVRMGGKNLIMKFKRN